MNKIKYALSMSIKFITKTYFSNVYDVNYVYKGFNPNRRGPFFLIGNHVLLLDAFFSNYAIKGYAIPVSSAFVYTNYKTKIGMTYAVDSIIKRKGQSDISTIRNIRKFVKDDRSIAVYPEGNTSYYGETTESMYSTAKLIKMQKIDVVVSKTKGGYFAKPRWRDTRTKKPYIELELFTLLKAEEIKLMSVDEIFKKMIESYYQNDYKWNQIEKHQYKGKNRLVGAHRVIYACPNCQSINNMYSEGDSIICRNCGEKGTINDYGFIDNTKYDNFVEWGIYQEKLLKDNLHKEYTFEVEMFKIDWVKYKKIYIDKSYIKYSKKLFIISNKNGKEEIEVCKITGAAYTEGNQFSFDYNNETYFFVTEQPMLFLDLTKITKED